MDAQITAYRHLLANIDSELSEDNIKSLKFLCEPHLGTKKSLTNFTNGLEIFDALEKNNKLSPQQIMYLYEMLHVIGRIDLAALINPDSRYSNELQYQQVDIFRVMLFRLSEELASEDLVRLRFLYDVAPKRAVIDDGIDLFSLMLQHKTLTATDLRQLQSILETIERYDLLDVVNQYIGCQPLNNFNITEMVPSTVFCNEHYSERRVQDLNIQSAEELMDESKACISESENSISENGSPSFLEVSPESSDFQKLFFTSLSMTDSSSCGVENIPISTEPARLVDNSENDVGASAAFMTGDDYTPMDCYKMDAVPRGLCIVIDNRAFQANKQDLEAVQNLGQREGSAIDSAALKKTFEKLKFVVDVKIDLTDVEIVALLRNISAMDHTPYDCFVCCLLSHGGENHIFGVNGRKVQLGALMSLYRTQACPSLSGKPKLFFLASCRGKYHQQAIQDRFNQQVPLFEEDKPQVDYDTSEWTPDEADFLFGYSTVANHVSYRSRTQGTFYIKELTNVLDKYAHREDLQTLLVRVNKAVCDRIYNDGNVVFKQTPAPQHTLRKLLKFL